MKKPHHIYNLHGAKTINGGSTLLIYILRNLLQIIVQNVSNKIDGSNVPILPNYF